ncbi:hypothetical protein CKAH01_01362 [Colletotrichum kahawae]|uniref:Uncharacterized protein n=1 Tax=Colletotrichum kahawae TaxID=34407 RepID=A0AAE0D2R1_COLKA|nr:hypothetical protein CKAH01_01362 [Colletotrichum kahawae]
MRDEKKKAQDKERLSPHASKQAQLQPDTQVKGQTARNTGAKSDLTCRGEHTVRGGAGSKADHSRVDGKGWVCQGRGEKGQSDMQRVKAKKKLEMDHQSTRTSSSC